MSEEKLKVLVADDEPTIRELMSLVLERDGHEVVTANDGVQALQKLRVGEFDALLSDIQMPHMNGIELLKQAKEIKPNLIVIIMTGFGTIETAVEAIKNGATDFITKPIRDLEHVPLMFKKARQLQALHNEVRALKELNRLQDEFLALLSHELRTPLTNVQGGLEAVRDLFSDGMAAEAKEFLASAITSTNDLTKVLESLLLMADFQNGRVVLNKENTDLNALLEEIFDTYSEARKQSATFLYEKSAEPVLLEIDQKLFSQAVSHVIDNALKFNRDKQDLVVKGSLAAIDGTLRISIHNNGRPIPEKEKTAIFRRFKQAEHYMTRTCEGVGLGLPITKSIVESHGGKISLDSSEAEGVTFFIDLPGVPSRATA